MLSARDAVDPKRYWTPLSSTTNTPSTTASTSSPPDPHSSYSSSGPLNRHSPSIMAGKMEAHAHARLPPPQTIQAMQTLPSPPLTSFSAIFDTAPGGPSAAGPGPSSAAGHPGPDHPRLVEALEGIHSRKEAYHGATAASAAAPAGVGAHMGAGRRDASSSRPLPPEAMNQLYSAPPTSSFHPVAVGPSTKTYPYESFAPSSANPPPLPNVYPSLPPQAPRPPTASRPSGHGPSRPTVRPVQHHHPYSHDSNDNSHSHGSASSLVKREKEEGKSSRAGLKRRQKYRRTRTGCLCCRSRRIKCDEARPVCRRCVIAKKTCQYPEEDEEDTKRSGKERPGQKRSRSSTSEGSSGGEEDADQIEPPQSQSSPNKQGQSVNKRKMEDDYGKGQFEVRPPDNPLLYPPLDNQGFSAVGLLPDQDFNWDASMIGTYEQPEELALGLQDNSNSLSFTTETEAQVDDWAGGMMGRQRWGPQGGAPMLATPNFLLPWFPTAEERSLILHYCANAADLMMAIPSGLNPMLAINLPLALDSPRGMNISADALRIALLGIGAIHQAFLLARSGVSTQQTAAMFQYASNLRDTGKEMVRRAAADKTGSKSDAALGAGTALATIDIFFGGSGWQDNFKLAKEMVAFRGGPAEMLKHSKPTLLADGVTMSPARMMLEILAIYETFGCLTTGQEPSLISDQWEPWWFDAGGSTYEEHSVEKQFGMSRMMVQLFARVTRLLARAAHSNTIITESDAPISLSNLTPSSNSSSGSPPSLLDVGLANLQSSIPLIPFGAADPLVLEARQLMGDVDAWIDSLRLTTLEHERVQVGNRAYAHAMKILLLRNVFKYPRNDSRVQEAAVEVLKHCSTSTALLGMSIDLTWPAIIAGCCVTLPDQRQWLLTLLEGFKSQCCFDIETATRIIQEAWRRVDANEGRGDWREVCEDLGLQVLLC